MIDTQTDKKQIQNKNRIKTARQDRKKQPTTHKQDKIENNENKKN